MLEGQEFVMPTPVDEARLGLAGKSSMDVTSSNLDSTKGNPGRRAVELPANAQ